MKINDSKHNATELDLALAQLSKMRPDAAKQFLVNHDLPEKNPFAKTKFVTDASLWSELQDLIAWFKKNPKRELGKMVVKRVREADELSIPSLEEFLMSEGREITIDNDIMPKLYPDTKKFTKSQKENMKLVRTLLLKMDKVAFSEFANDLK